MTERRVIDADRAGARRLLRHRAAWALGAVVAVVMAAYLVARGIAEFFVIGYASPASYRNDWGGPSLAGVLAVHSGPGLAILAAASAWLYRRRRARGGDAL